MGQLSNFVGGHTLYKVCLQSTPLPLAVTSHWQLRAGERRASQGFMVNLSPFREKRGGLQVHGQSITSSSPEKVTVSSLGYLKGQHLSGVGFRATLRILGTPSISKSIREQFKYYNVERKDLGLFRQPV